LQHLGDADMAALREQKARLIREEAQQHYERYIGRFTSDVG
jgi:hypothetical protein